MVRLKHRWVLFQINQDPTMENGQVVYHNKSIRLNDQMISRAIYMQLETYYGQFGKGTGNLTVRWYNPDTRLGIIRVSRDYADMYLSTMFYMNKVATVPCSMNILQVSGTLIFIQEAAIEFDRLFYLKEQEEAQKKGQHYSSIGKIQASLDKINGIS